MGILGASSGRNQAKELVRPTGEAVSPNWLAEGRNPGLQPGWTRGGRTRLQLQQRQALPEACAAQAASSAVHEPGSLPTTTRWRRISTVPILPGEKLRLTVKLATVTQPVHGEIPIQTWAV